MCSIVPPPPAEKRFCKETCAADPGAFAVCRAMRGKLRTHRGSPWGSGVGDEGGEGLAAGHRPRGFGNDIGPGAGGVVFALDQQPLGLLPRPGALQGEAALELLAVEDEDRVAAVERLRPGHPAALLVGAAVP